MSGRLIRALMCLTAACALCARSDIQDPVWSRYRVEDSVVLARHRSAALVSRFSGEHHPASLTPYLWGDIMLLCRRLEKLLHRWYCPPIAGTYGHPLGCGPYRPSRTPLPLEVVTSCCCGPGTPENPTATYFTVTIGSVLSPTGNQN